MLQHDEGDFTIMTKIKLWIKAVRAPFFTASIVPVILGSVIAWYQFHSINWLYFWLTLAGVIMAHAGTNLANDYFDHTSGNDEANKTPTPFSGGSRVIQNNLIPPIQILIAALGAFMICAIIGIYLNMATGGKVVLVLGIIGIFLGFFYSAAPLRLDYKGWAVGELSVGIGFGPLVVVGAYYVQVQKLDWLPIWASIPVGILIALVVYINEFPDYEADRTVNKRTLPVVIGKRYAMIGYDILLGISYIWIIGGVIMQIFPAWTLLALITLPIAIKAVITLHKHYEEVYALMPANASTILLHLCLGIIFSLGFFLSRI